MPTQLILTTHVTINMAGTNANFTNRERCKFPKSLTWWNMFKLLCCTICPKVWSKHRIFWEVKGLLEKPSLLAQIPTSWLTWLLTKPKTGTTLPWLIRLLRFDPFHDAFPSHLSQPLQKKRSLSPPLPPSPLSTPTYQPGGLDPVLKVNFLQRGATLQLSWQALALAK